MFEGLDLSKVFQQAQQLQEQLQKEKENKKNNYHTISIAGGMLQIEINEEMEVRKIDIDKSLLEEKELDQLPEILRIGFNQAVKEMKKHNSPDLQNIMENLKKNFPTQK